MAKSRDPLAPPPGPSPSRRDSSEIVEAVVAAALAIGDPQTSVNTIAARAGVGVASLYRYFPSKTTIYAEISRRLQRDFLRRLREVLATPGLTVPEAVRACCALAVDVPGVSRDLRRSLNLAVPLSWSEETANAAFSASVAEIVAWLGARLVSPPADLQERVFVAFAAARGLVMMSRLLPDLAPTDDVLVDRMVRGTLAYLDLGAFALTTSATP